MNLKELLGVVGNQLLKAAAALTGESLVDIQRGIIEAQGDLIKSQDAVAESWGRTAKILTRWKDTLEELVDHHAGYIEGLERKLEARDEYIGRLEKTQAGYIHRLERNADLQSLLADVLMGMHGIEDFSSDE